MDSMKNNATKMLRVLSALALGLMLMAGITNAQPAPAQKASPEPTKGADSKKSPKESTETTPTSTTVGDDAGDYTITSSIEVGYRGERIVGDVNKYKSDLNYKAGPRLFDSSFLMRSQDDKGGPFDTLLVTSSGWGADPTGQMRLSVEKPKWYKFEASYRRFKYFRNLNNFANPNWLFTGFPVRPNPATGLHGYNTRTEFGDFDLTILPKNETIRFIVGFSPERYSGPFFSTYHIGGNEFQLLTNAKSRANDFRLGAEGTLGPIDFSFLQGLRLFRDDSFIDVGPTQGINPNPLTADFTSFKRTERTRGSIDFTRLSIHSLIAKKLDITGRIIHSSASSNSVFLENITGVNYNPPITGLPARPNVLNLGQYNIPANVNRPNTLGDIGVTLLATDRFRISNTFRVEDFEISGVAIFNNLFTISSGATTVTRGFNNLNANKSTKYRKYQDTFEGDYQFNNNYSVHFGYRYGSRRTEQVFTGYNLQSNAPTLQTPEDETETNHTNAFFGGFKARPVKNWTIYFDAERGTADNVFTRIGNYDYTNIRAKSRYTPNARLSFNVALITRNNSNPSEIAGVTLNDFGVDVKSRTFTSSIDWAPTSRLSFSTGYNYNWVNSDAVVEYDYSGVNHPLGHTLYFMRNNFFYIDTTARLFPRATLYASYRINQDNGQGNRLADPTGTPGTLINSYPMNFQSPEGRLAIRLNRQLDWNLGYQYYSYNESKLVSIFPASPRAQNYHAHLPYMSLRLYFGRKE
jgi:hypothetical protein